jgi:hypothetical protein
MSKAPILTSTPMVIVMDCGDDLIFTHAPPRINEIIYCHRCATYRRVVTRTPEKKEAALWNS